MVSGTNKRRQKETSKIAHRSILEDLPQRRAEVAMTVNACPGITIKESAYILDRDKNAISGRFTELEDAGIIKTCGVKYFHDGIQPHAMYKVIKDL